MTIHETLRIDIGQSPGFEAFEWHDRIILSRTVGKHHAYAGCPRAEILDMPAWLKTTEAKINDRLMQLAEGEQ